MRSVYRWVGVTSAIIVAFCAGSLPARQVRASITVTVRSGDGTENPVGGAQISIAGTTLNSTTTPLGKAHLAGVPSGPQTIVVRLLGFCVTRRTVNVPVTGEVAVTVWICADAVGIDNPDDAVVLLADTRLPDASGSHCENDLLKAGHGGVAIPENALALSSGTSSCAGAVAVFSEGRALSYMNDATVLPWTDDVGDLYEVTRPSRLLRVPVTFWMTGMAGKDAVKETIITVHLATANDLLRTSMAGLELVADETAGGEPAVGDADAIAGAATDIGTGCDNVPTIKANAAIYDPTRLNVYYVNADAGSPNGYSCSANGGQNIIFMYWGSGKPKPGTLAHELGHALGLDRPDWGHTNILGGFYKDASGLPLNVMYSLADVPSYFSVGQAAQMNVGVESFLNTSVAGSTVRSRQAAALGAMPMFVCGCPENIATADCAALNRDIVRTGAVTTPTTDVLACTVTATPSAVTVACGSSQHVTAAITQSGVAALGEARWYNSDPTTVAVLNTNSSAGSAWGDLKGLKVGTAEVRIYGGGPYAIVPVTVTPPCPAS